MDRNEMLRCIGKTPEDDEQFFIQNNPKYATYKCGNKVSQPAVVVCDDMWARFDALDHSGKMNTICKTCGKRLIGFHHGTTLTPQEITCDTVENGRFCPDIK